MEQVLLIFIAHTTCMQQMYAEHISSFLFTWCVVTAWKILTFQLVYWVLIYSYFTKEEMKRRVKNTSQPSSRVHFLSLPPTLTTSNTCMQFVGNVSILFKYIQHMDDNLRLIMVDGHRCPQKVRKIFWKLTSLVEFNFCLYWWRKMTPMFTYCV